MLKNITLSAEAALIERARRRAREERKSFNDLFREWIARYVGGGQGPAEYRSLMSRLAHIEAGRTFSRDELNER